MCTFRVRESVMVIGRPCQDYMYASIGRAPGLLHEYVYVTVERFGFGAERVGELFGGRVEAEP